MFVGRKVEIKLIKDKLLDSNNQSIIVYGRRRVGKSRLIFEALKDISANIVFYECYQSSYKDNLNSLTKEVQTIYKNQYLSFNSLEDIIIFMASQPKKNILYIDEYPLMRQDKSTDSLIKNALDKIDLNDSLNNFKLILCGSSIDVMSILNDKDMPLHGRFTLNINLKPLNYLESSKFYSNSSNEDKILYYSVFGGIPYFLKQIDPKKSFRDNLIDLYIKENALLKTELNNQILSEISKIENANFILNIINNKSISYTDIKSVFNNSYPNKSIDYALNKLISLQIIEKHYSFSNNKTKKPYYKIKDNSFSFYYNYLYNVGSKLMLYSAQEYYKNFIEDDFLTQFVPKKFEDICEQFLRMGNKNNLFDFKLLDLYKYMFNDKTTRNNYEFDLVGETKNGLINFECKYSKKPVSMKDIYIENNQANKVLNHFYKLAFISKSGYTKDVDKKEYILFDLNDLFDTKIQ